MTESLESIDAAIADLESRRTLIIRQINAATTSPTKPTASAVQVQAKPAKKGKIIEFRSRN